MKVSEAMNKVVVSEDNIKVLDAAKIMSEKRIGSLVIMNRDKIAGIITESDILKNVDKLNKKISEVMSKNVIIIDEKENLDNAALLMKKNRIKRLPVLSKGKLIGIITVTDLIANSEELNENFFFD